MLIYCISKAVSIHSGLGPHLQQSTTFTLQGTLRWRQDKIEQEEEITERPTRQDWQRKNYFEFEDSFCPLTLSALPLFATSTARLNERLLFFLNSATSQSKQRVLVHESSRQSYYKCWFAIPLFLSFYTQLVTNEHYNINTLSAYF